MGNNYFTPYSNTAPKTAFTVASMGAPLAELDKAITYAKNVIVHCDGDITWSSGTLTWSNTIRILFNTAAGLAVQNTIAAGSIALSDNEFCYVTLSETNDTVLTMSKAAVTTAAASNFLAVARLVMGYRNADSDEFYAVALKDKWGIGSSSVSQLRDDLDALDGREQAITCADAVTIDWSLGATARMTFDRDAVALTLSNGVNGQVYRLLVKQSAGGSDTLTYATTIKWSGGAVPTLTTDGNAEDIITFVQINGAWYASATLKFATPA